MDHSLISPSKAYIWGAENGCRAFPRLHAQYHRPDTYQPSEAAMEGTAAHEVAESYIKAISNPVHPLMKEGDVASNGIVVTRQMIEGAELYAASVREVAERFRNYDIHVERRVESPSIHRDLFGYEDCAIVEKPMRQLHIWDYKFGRNVVEAEENLQMMCYTAANYDMYIAADDPKPSNWEVFFHVVQPRVYHIEGPVRTWRTDFLALKPYFKQLHEAAALALGPGTPAATSGKHCSRCNARHACQAARAAGVQMFEAVTEGYGVDMSLDAMALEYELTQRALEQLEAISSAYEEQLTGAIKTGKRVTGYELKQGRGSVAWNCDVAEVKALGDMLGVETTKLSAITPKQAITAGVPEDIIAGYSDHKPGALKLSKTNSKMIKRIFEKGAE